MSSIATPDSARAGIPADAVEALRAEVRGDVLDGPGGARDVFNAMHPGAAALVVRATGVADVVAAVNFARDHGLELAVRGGGHSIAGLSATDGGLLLDFAAMNGVHVDADRRQATVQGGALYPLEDIATVLRGWRAYVADAPDEVTSVIVTMTFPANPEMPEAIHDRPVAIVGAVYAGDPEEGLRVTAPLRELATPLLDMSGPTPFTGVQTGFDPLFPRGELRAYWKSQYVEELTDEALDIVARLALDRPAPGTMVNVFHMGGAIAAVDPEATAFATRSAPYMISLDGVWNDAADDARVVTWIRDAWQRTKAVGTGDVYLNFTGLADEAPSAGVETAFGRNLERLAQIKATYDPENLFRRNNNIAPSS